MRRRLVEVQRVIRKTNTLCNESGRDWLKRAFAVA